jgi:hypothetical protein
LPFRADLLPIRSLDLQRGDGFFLIHPEINTLENCRVISFYQ